MDTPAYDPNNIFAKILRKEIPCNFVCEDADTFVFMDIMPRSDGHALVIPKQPARNILDAPAGLLAPLMRTVQRVAIAAQNAFNADGMTISQFSSRRVARSCFICTSMSCRATRASPCAPPG